jgi:8-oxo-dGTP pyrophosphatase MutT (NUDIX family)
VQPRHREFSCAIVLDTEDRLLLQERENIPTIVLPGMISLFGGHREAGETFAECIARELNEELSYFIAPERIEHLGTHRGADIDIGVGTAVCEYFLVRGVPLDEIVVTEGTLLVVDLASWPALGERLAPIARQALQLFTNRALTS